MKPDGNRSGRTEPDPMRTLRLVGAVAAILAVLGLTIAVLWLVIRFPRF